ncbi:hypothetical protein I203_106379 [Kwoniella mangroviensis CBS 8507]|uniref:uncharacterized protein n=1 Tax=Kwoniella mangroviensis CBS 8507 TaxID=1296122 RepID=UPI00304CD61C
MLFGRIVEPSSREVHNRLTLTFGSPDPETTVKVLDNVESVLTKLVSSENGTFDDSWRNYLSENDIEEIGFATDCVGVCDQIGVLTCADNVSERSPSKSVSSSTTKMDRYPY